VVDLDAYFARTGYRGSREPTLETLHGMVHAHVQSIPFENLDVIRGTPIELTPDALEAKLVGARRGGYCFEQNGLLLEVLGQLGFEARPLSARVCFGRPRDFIPARTHLCVRVELAEAWLVDVGFGGHSLSSAIRLADEDAQTTPHETRRLLREDRRVFHQALLADTWSDLYVMTLEEMPFIDRVVANWYTSTHPDSHFRHNLLVSRALPDGQRISILNRELKIRKRDGSVDLRVLATHDELIGALSEHFGLVLPPGTQLACTNLAF
jgi:N-hydroxyarylamine O-acetyltransferase